MCLARPTVPSPNEQCPWADNLIKSSKVDVSCYQGLSRPAALQKLLTLGTKLNIGNPWARSTSPRDALRKNLGLWKAIGANASVLSWHAYDLCLRFQGHIPEHLSLTPLDLTAEENEFLLKSADKYIAMDKYWLPPPGYPALLSPQFVQHSIREDGTDKMRAVDHLQYLNAHLATHGHRMETLKKTIPASLSVLTSFSPSINQTHIARYSCTPPHGDGCA